MPLTWFDRSIAWFAPQYALKRQSARMLLNTLAGSRSERGFDAISGDRLRGDWTSVTRDADASNVTSLETLRNRIRELRRNSGIIAGPIKRIANNVIGQGIRPQARVKEDTDLERTLYSSQFQITAERAERFNYQAERLWKQFVEKADSRLMQNFYEMQLLSFQAMFGDGEVIVVARSSAQYKKYGRIIPLCLEVVEIDRLYQSLAEISNQNFRYGIEYDDEGIPITYHILKRHPGSTLIGKYAPTDMEKVAVWSEAGMRKLYHLFDMLRPGQSRGYTPFAAGLKDAQDLDRYLEAEIVGARVAACLAAFVKSPAAYTGFTGLETNSKSEKISEFQPGMIKYLAPGEEVEVFSSNRPNQQFGILVERLLRNMANAVDIPYEVFANDWGNLNYSNARTVLLQAYLAFRIYQGYMIAHFCKPVWENFISDCVAQGLLDAPGFAVRRFDYLRHAWIPPGWQWVDPLKESQAARSDLDACLDTLADVLSGKGDDWEEVLEQRAVELKKQKELEGRYGITFGGTPKIKEMSTKENGSMGEAKSQPYTTYRADMSKQDWIEAWKKDPHWAKSNTPSPLAKYLVVEDKENTSKSNLLEIGCGNGRDAKYFGERGYNVIGIDLSPDAVFLAQKENSHKNVLFQVGDAENLTFRNGQFDAVYSLSVLHLTDLSKSIPELARVMTENALALLFLYVKTTYKSKDDKEKQKTEINFKISDLEKIYKNQGLKINDKYRDEREDKDDDGEHLHSIIVYLLKKETN